MLASALLALATSLATASAAVKGFNYGSTGADGAPMTQANFEQVFKAASALQGAPGFNSARLYTMIQAGTTNDVTQAIPAAMDTGTRLLLGMWASSGEADFQNELTAFNAAVSQYGSKFLSLVDGISVGSEDLYRITPTGIQNKAGIGAGPAVITSYISQLRKTIAGGAASSIPIGHVDTWTAWVNGSNVAVIDACDWIGVDSYPYFETTIANSIENAKSAFFKSLQVTKDAAQGKPVWVTETGYPVSGPKSGEAVASIANAKTYWDEVGCALFSEGVNTYWYTLDDEGASPSFGLVDTLGGAPLYDLSCSGVKTTTTHTGGSKTGSSKNSTSSGVSAGAKPHSKPAPAPAPKPQPKKPVSSKPQPKPKVGGGSADGAGGDSKPAVTTVKAKATGGDPKPASYVTSTAASGGYQPPPPPPAYGTGTGAAPSSTSSLVSVPPPPGAAPSSADAKIALVLGAILAALAAPAFLV